MTVIWVEASAGGGVPKIRLHAGLLQPRLVSRSTGFAHIALVAGGATLLGGDSVSISVRVGPGCTVRIEDIGGTVAYPSTGTASQWNVDVEVENGGALVWESFPFIVTDSAVVDRNTSVSLGEAAVICLRETLVLGRSGEAGGNIRASTDIRGADGLPYFVEQLSLDGARPRPGVLGRATVLDSAIVAGADMETESHARSTIEAERPTSSESQTTSPSSADGDRVLILKRPGAVARAIGTAAHSAQVDARWRRWMDHVIDAKDTRQAGADQAAATTSEDECSGTVTHGKNGVTRDE
ncbi:MAG: urease accessory protein UreD [Brevibacterium aurantiacum]|uniref:urease accessory protein UreD n=1 Tax=Brevibacterium aurantiacum TaxID=273384 RepID=UPI003F919C96